MISRNQSLDVLRGVAVLFVIMHHEMHFLPWGWIGVDLFFVLSGFLISGLLFSELQESGTISIRRFLFRRGMKIYPSYFLFVLVTAIFSRELRRYLVEECLFFQNYTFLHPLTEIIPGTHSWLHTWSLAVEEHFYLVVPFLLLGFYRLRQLRWIPAISLVSIFACFAMRVWHMLGIAHPSVFVEESHLRFDGLFAGVAIGYLWSYERDSLVHFSRKLPLWAAAPFLLPAVLLPSDSFRYTSVLVTSGVLTTNLIASSIVLIYCLTRNVKLETVAWLGRHSYSIYLWHMPVMVYQVIVFRELYDATAILFGAPPLNASAASPVSLLFVVWIFMCAIGSIALGILMSKAIEIPMLKFRDRLVPSHRFLAPKPANVPSPLALQT